MSKKNKPTKQQTQQEKARIQLKKESIISAAMLGLFTLGYLAGPCLALSQSTDIFTTKHIVYASSIDSKSDLESTPVYAYLEQTAAEAVAQAEALAKEQEEAAIAVTATAVYAEAPPVRHEPETEIETGAEDLEAVQSFEVPSASTGFKSWMDYRTITARNSLQYKLQQDATTDSNGFRRYNGYYMVALGTYYTGYRCGKTFRVTLDTGKSFECITGDVKDDKHTDAKNQHRRGNVVEFIVDTRAISKSCRQMGDMSYADPKFKGNIAKIESIFDETTQP